jgi:hypothetical protein
LDWYLCFDDVDWTSQICILLSCSCFHPLPSLISQCRHHLLHVWLFMYLIAWKRVSIVPRFK